MAKKRTYLTLSQAAKQTGKSKSVISKALKNGTLSYASKDTSGYKIDAAELFRVFSRQEIENAQEPRSQTPENGQENPLENALKFRELETENKLLHERMKDKEARIEELQEERNEWRSQAQKLLLTYQPSSEGTQNDTESQNGNLEGDLTPNKNHLLRSQLWAILKVTVVVVILGLLMIANAKGTDFF